MIRLGINWRVAAAAFALLILPAQAHTTQTDVLIAGRALGFVDNLKHSSPVHLGIVYDPRAAQSVEQAEEIRAALGTGLRIGALTFVPDMVPVANLNKANADALFLTNGLDEGAAAVGRASRRLKIPCITFDLAAVRGGVCAMGIRTQPSVEVFVNRAAATACGLDLAAVFRIMVVEI